MKARKSLLAALVVALAAAGNSWGLEFQPLGAGAIGVGGAGVSRAAGAAAAYWNPALLAAKRETNAVSIIGAAGIVPGGNLSNDLNNISDSYDIWNADQLNAAKATTLINAINNTSPSDNLRGTMAGGLGAQIGHFGFGAFGTFEATGVPQISPTPLVLPTDAASLATFQATLSESHILIRGITLVEAPLSYGHEFDFGGFGKLGVGASLKYLYGETTSANPQIITNNTVISSKDVTKELSKNRKGSSNFGIDVGALWRFDMLALGVVGKNLNSPRFDTTAGPAVQVDRQARAGATVSPLSWLDVSCDVDLTRNTTTIAGLRSQQLGGGAEFKPYDGIKFRVGGSKELSTASSGSVTAGLTLGVAMFNVDIDGAYGLGTVKWDNHTYPTEARVQFSANVVF